MCDTLFSCFMTHFNYGLRTDGGIGEYIKLKSFNHKAWAYGARFIFILGFFIIVTIILMSIVFGIVIDTFAGLREKYNLIEYDKNNVCFICGVSRDDLEKYGGNFESHINEEHKIWTYVEYIMGLKFVDSQETNSVNSYVIEMISKKNIAWFPSFKGNQKEKDFEEHQGK